MDIAINARSISVDGRRLAYLEAGSGSPAIVALHGIGSSVRSWRPVLPLLGKMHRMIAWDMPGYGDSDPLADERLSGRDYADSVDAIVSLTDGQPVILLGHSLGALIAAAYARRHPERVRGLVLADPALGGGISPEAPWPEKVTSRVNDLKRQGPAAFAAARAPRLCADGAAPGAVEAVEREMARVRLPGYTQAASVLAQGDLAPDIAAIDRPVRILVGAEDRITPPDPIEAMAARLGIPVERMAGIGHAGYVENPELYAGAVLAAAEVMA